MSQIFGNLQAQAKLKQALDNSVRSLCLTGPSHVGKSTFLKDILYNFASDSDLFIAETKIDSVREAVEFCKTQPLSGRNRYVIVDDAHKLADSAQDAYLKLLEDPGEHSCLVFIVPDEGLLLPALRSRFRCIISWNTLSLSDMRNFSISIGYGEDSRVLMLCDGRPGLFRFMFEEDGGKDYIQLHEILVQAFTGEKNLLLEPVPQVVKEAKEIIQRECVAHICRSAALTMFKLKKPSIDQVSSVLRYSSLLLSIPSANAENHWYRMASHISSLM